MIYTDRIDTTIAPLLRLLAVTACCVVLLLATVRTGQAEEIVCIQCHTALPEKYSQPVKLWRTSIHEENGIACNACHGGDPKDAANAMSPARGFLGVPKDKDIPAFCGRCHVGVLKDYQNSAHGRALGRGGPTCVTCHGNHKVVKASLDLINEQTCTRCHTFERARLIKAAMQDAESHIVAIDARIAAFKQQGADTERLEKGLFAVRNRFHSLFHEVNVKKVTEESTGIKVELKKLEEALQAMTEERQTRKIGGAIVVSVCLVLALLVHLLRKTYP